MTGVWKNMMRWDTDYSADSVEWCPVASFHNMLVCGTYQLQKTDQDQPAEKQTRLGKIYLFDINNGTTELSPVQTIQTFGVLDQKWCYHTVQNYAVLALVTSTGTLQLYRLKEKENGFRELELWLEHVISPDVLALSVDWSTNRQSSEEPRLVVSDSAGCTHILSLVGDTLQVIGTWKCHCFEAWIGAFNYWDADVFYSGGDDCMLKRYDVRIPEVATIVNKSHEAGVTAIRSHIDVEHQLLTGSYDEKVRLWDTRQLKSCLSEENVKGGVWRLKWHPYKAHVVVAACMYGGFRVLHVDNNVEILSEYMEHESIAYGADWKFDKYQSLVATSSFYDCKMHISEVIL